jgi:hypothetical protein
MNIFRKALLVAAAAMGGTFAMQANAVPLNLTIGDPYYIGTVDPATPADASAEVGFINYLLGMATGATADVHVPGPPSRDYDYSRVGSTLNTAGLPTATTVGGTKDSTSPPTVIDITGWSYVFAKYASGAAVWYVGGLTGEIQIPATQSINNNSGIGLSHWSLYNPGTTIRRVPEPMTMGLLGLGLLGLGLARRRRA